MKKQLSKAKLSSDKDANNSDSKPDLNQQQVDRPGFDLGGSSGKTSAGQGLGLGDDAEESPKEQRLPR
jgi:hypothetical protein